MKKRRKIDLDDHDPKICFRCRLYDLWKELKKDTDPKFALYSMGEACGSILSQLDTKDFMMFMILVKRTMEEDSEFSFNKPKETRH